MYTFVDANLWRGSRPTPDEYAQIKKQFSSVISLEGLAEDEKERAELAPAIVVSMPISFWEIYLTGISQDRITNILGLIKAAKQLSLPVLVHCEHGEDRTGLIVAAYRVRVCGWTKELAFTEALKYGYREWANFGLNKTWSKFS